MIESFRCKYTENLYKREWVKRFSGFERQAEKRLRILDVAQNLEDLQGLPSNRFEGLLGDRKGQYSIRINKQYKQWRIVFKWNTGPYDVEIVDYHI